MKSNVRAVFMLLAGLVVFSMIATGCGSKQEDGTKTDSKTEAGRAQKKGD